MALLAFSSTSHLCDLVQGNFLIFLAWWDFLSAASNQNTCLCHAHGLYGSSNTCSYCACWDLPSFFPAISRKDHPWFSCSSGMFKGVYYWLRAEEIAFLLSRSFFSSIRAFLGRGPYSVWRGRFASIRSTLLLFLAIIASSAFIKFWAEWMSSAMV